MKNPPLPKNPLIEVIFELRWELSKVAPDIYTDQNYKILIGRFYERIIKKYPFYEQLATASMPEELAGYIIQHRFRTEKKGWPLVQIGPGIITLNDTKKNYKWEKFYPRLKELLKVLFEAYPDSKNNLKIINLQLRYLDSIDFDYAKENIFNFLEEQMKTSLKLADELFEETGVKSLPTGIDFKSTFHSDKPPGLISLRFMKGKNKENNSNTLMWETGLQTISGERYNTTKKITTWLIQAHDLILDWFYKIVKGELERSFK